MYVIGNLKANLLPVTPLPGSLNLIVNSPLKLIHISLNISNETLALNHDNEFYLISQSILIACLLENVWILKGDITYLNLLCEFKGRAL